ncbi:glyoxalase [Rhizobium cremeum]|uniref:glyoxalase superfamily protein n=1 Tax=Rhizobium cremeum TaxID=2813827 RepID=UPI000DD9EEC5|nr:glyoxalase superfamily protein [Rhizobium cremeum]MCJ7997773.1 glyoxalase [Rhizobium cremeum]MCJ8002867.1 glyoxalase [Rhizobium cremeum]
MNAENPVDFNRVDVLPILPSLNFSQTREFYVEKLGFEAIEKTCDEYMGVRRDGLELHFWLCQDPTVCDSSSVFFRSENVWRLFEDFDGRGVEITRHVDENDQPVDKFHVRDPHGNLLLFGRRLGPPPA